MVEPVVALIGPTASGKSSLAIALALALDAEGRKGEIINGDSMLIYRGMDIGTAKPGLAERGGVPHHLIDVLDVTEQASVAQFQAWARTAIADCRQRHVIPIVVGGSALYVHAILDEMEFPGTDPEVRTKWEGELARLGAPALHAELARRDPVVAADILAGNGRRIVRALEVIELTGSFTAKLPTPRYALDVVFQIGLSIERQVLDKRIADRVEAMWEAGFVAEVVTLAKRGLRDGRTASRALGYRQVLAALDGDCTLEDARVATVQATRRFARKQMGWFNRDDRIEWLPYDAPDLVERCQTLIRRGAQLPA